MPRIAPSLGTGTQESCDSPIGPATSGTVVTAAGGAVVVSATSGVVVAVVVETVEVGARTVAGSVDGGAQPALPAASRVAMTR